MTAWPVNSKKIPHEIFSNVDGEFEMTKILLSGYDIHQKTLGESVLDIIESQLLVELTFISRDWTPEKYNTFLMDLKSFLEERNKKTSAEA